MSPQQPQEPKRFTGAEAKLIAFGVLALLAGFFTGQNVGKVPVHFVFFTARIRLIWVFLLCIVIGVALDRLLQAKGLLLSRKDRRERRAQRKAEKKQQGL